MAPALFSFLSVTSVLASCQAFIPASQPWRATLGLQKGAATPGRRMNLAMEATNYKDDGQFFRMSKGFMEFGARDEVDLRMDAEHDNIHRYITQSPERIVPAMWDKELVIKVAQDVFRLTTRPVQFVSLTFQPCIEIKVWREDEQLNIKSMSCRIIGLERILGNRFTESLKVEVHGKLRAIPDENPDQMAVRLLGEVVFFTSGQLPRLLAFTPKVVLETAAGAVNRRIMNYAKTRFVNNLARDYSRWMCEVMGMESATVPDVQPTQPTLQQR